jgi:4'-phosphopantetheinyl transferase
VDRDTVEIAWLDVRDIEEQTWPELARLIDESERTRADRFRFEADRQAYIAAHALVRARLSCHAAVDAADWQFTTGSSGRPEIVPRAGLPPLRFNLSHTRGLVAIAVTAESDVGLDVECLDRSDLTMALAAEFFAEAEVADLRAMGGPREALFGVWTLKEAYLKAIGQGLMLPLKSFSVRLDPPGLRAPANEARRWLMRRFQPTADHLMALALRHPNPDRVTVTCGAVDARALAGGFTRITAPL